MLLRNKNYCPDTNMWRIFFCGPKANSTRSCLLVGKYLVWGDFSGQNTFSKIVALIVLEGQIRPEVDKSFFSSSKEFSTYNTNPMRRFKGEETQEDGS